MTAYLPPTDDLAIFDPSVFLSDDDTLTQAQADNRYCLYPNVQGSLNLINASVNGTLDMSNNNITNINQISCNSAETNITALNRINQSLSVGTDNNSVTGFYSKAKDVFPALQSNATALKAVTNFNYSNQLIVTNFTTNVSTGNNTLSSEFLNVSMNKNNVRSFEMSFPVSLRATINSGLATATVDWRLTAMTVRINRNGSLYQTINTYPENTPFGSIRDQRKANTPTLSVGNQYYGNFKISFSPVNITDNSTDTYTFQATPTWASTLFPAQVTGEVIINTTTSGAVSEVGTITFDNATSSGYSTGQINNQTINNLPNTNNYTCCCWCPFFRKFVILASNGSNRGYISDDGINFTTTAINNSSDWQNVCFIPEINRVVAVANSGTFRIQYSDNLTTWTTPTTTPAFQNCRGIAYSPQLKKLVVTCIDGVQRIWVSNDYGVTWSLRQVSAQSQWINVCWCDTLGLFVAVSTNVTPQIMISKNGDNWYTVSPPADNTTILLRDVCFSRSLGMIVASGVNSTDTSKRMIYSYNGIDWFSGSITSPSSDSRFFRVRWSPQLKVFVAISNVSTGASTLRWIYSFDGINWTPVSTLGNDDSWWGLDWSEEMSTFLAVGHPNAGSTMNNRVMMSSLNARLPTANNFFGNINNNDISENGNWLINFRNIKVDTEVKIGGTANILSGTANGASGKFLNVNINGNPYKIQLLND